MYGADPAPLSPLWLLCNGQFVVQVTYPALFALIGLVGFIVVYQVIQTQDHTADTAAWAALTGLIGFVTGAMVSSIYSYRFATTRNSSANQAVMAELARRPTSQ